MIPYANEIRAYTFGVLRARQAYAETPIAAFLPEVVDETCKAGHEWTEANTYRDHHGRRHCRACALASQKRLRDKRKAALAEKSTEGEA